MWCNVIGSLITIDNFVVSYKVSGDMYGGFIIFFIFLILICNPLPLICFIPVLYFFIKVNDVIQSMFMNFKTMINSNS